MEATTLFSIGHSNKSADTLIAELRAHGIAYLADVRSRPYSRYNPQFNKKALEAALQAAGITYVFMGDSLGGRPADESCYTNGKPDYTLMRQIDTFKQGISRLVAAHEKKLRLAIMCSEGKPQHCHRSLLVAEALRQQGIEVQHILSGSEVILHSALMAEISASSSSGGSLFQ